MKNYKLVIFDWDGTVMDSVGRIVSSMRSAAEDVGLMIPSPEQVKNIIGISLPEATNILFPNQRAKKYEELRLSYKKFYTEIDETPTPLFAYAENLFNELLDDGKLLAVATGKGRDGLSRIFAETQTEKYFHASRCAKECQSKPNPEMLLQLLDELSISASEAVMVGDTVHDMEMAKNANVDRIGVSFGVHKHAELSQFSPVAIVDSLKELSMLLKRK